MPVLSTLSQQDSNITFVNRWAYGPNFACYVHNSYGYIGNGGILQILNISQLSFPQLTGEIVTPGIIEDIFVESGYAYVATSANVSTDNPGLRVIDVTDPSKPMEVTHLELNNLSTYGVSILGNYAYVANGWGGFQIVDISDPSSPVTVGSFDTNGFTMSAVISGNLVYLADGLEGVRIVDVSDLSNPSEVGFYDTNGYARHLTVSGQYVYVADQDYGLRVIDISDPLNPFETGFFDTEGSARDVVASGSYAYVADDWNGLQVIDVSDPENPKGISSVRTYTHELIGSGANRVFISESIAYVADWYNGFHIIDVSNRTNPTELSHIVTKSWAYDFKAEGVIGYLIDGAYGLVQMDLSDPSNPVEERYLNPEDWGYSFAIETTNNYLFVANGWGGVKIVDKTSFTEIGSYDAGASIWNVTVSKDGNHIYVPAMSNGFKIVNIENPESPLLIGEYPPREGSEFFDVVVHNDKAYVSDFNGRYFVLDVSDISHPTLVGSIQTSQYGGNHVGLNFPYLYAADGDRGLQVIDVSDPSAPVLMKTIDTPGWGWNVQILGDYLYFCDSNNGILVFDVSDPIDPVEIAFYNTVGQAEATFISGKYIYVADGFGGLYTLQSNSVSIEEGKTIYPVTHHLFQNYPNPFNPVTTIRYDLREQSDVLITIYDLLGRQVRILVNQTQNAGFKSVNWDGTDELGRPAGTGIYLYQIQAGNYTETRKMIFLK